MEGEAGEVQGYLPEDDGNESSQLRQPLTICLSRYNSYSTRLNDILELVHEATYTTGLYER